MAIDDRSDLYGKDMLEAYTEFADANADWDSFLDDYAIQYVVTPSHSAAGTLLRASADWRLRYEDSVAAVFARAAEGSAQ